VTINTTEGEKKSAHKAMSDDNSVLVPNFMENGGGISRQSKEHPGSFDSWSKTQGDE